MVTTAVPVLVRPQRSLYLRGARLGPAASDGPLLLQRMDQKVVPAVLDELSRADVEALLATQAKARDASGTLKLFHPVQRAHHLALFEICCSRPGEPRLDPLRIESAGLVLRRIWRDPAASASSNARLPAKRAKNGRGELESARLAPSLDLMARRRIRPDVLEGWRQQGQKLRGWVPFSGEDDLDPDPARRPAPRTGNAEMDRRLALWRGVADDLSEEVTPLFPAPPAVAEALGRTILYGIVPVASMELTDVPTAGAFDQALVRDRLSPFLRSGGKAKTMPLAGQRITRAMLDDPTVQATLDPYVNLLRQLVFELDAFGDSAASRALFAALETVQLVYGPGAYPCQRNGTRTAGTTLRQHAEVLVHRAATPEKRAGEVWSEYPAVDLPAQWPVVSRAVEDAIVTAGQQVLNARMGIAAPNEPRFGDATRLYKLRAFARVKRPGGCPPRLVWSGYSEPFVIAPWYDSAGAPPVQVALPDVTDRAAIKQLKPNVSFVVPASLAKFLNQSDPKSLLKGDGPPVSDDAPGTPGPDGLELKVDWLCAFNIPTITLCAFIVLNIFLSLLDLFLGWLKLAIKICLPFPHLVPRKSPSP